MMRAKHFEPLCFGIVFLAFQGCSITVGATEGTSDSFVNTSDSAEQSIEASSGFTSSTSPRSHGTTTAAGRERAARAFASRNLSNLREDVAFGEGEYLTAVAELLDVPAAARPQYYSDSKTAFSRYALESEAGAGDLAELLIHLAQ
ncbi:MAG: DUF3015 family protein [Bdellovibrionales bacterium]|nr:DUF3015 family protein [Bdellovibrionales bacterium]